MINKNSITYGKQFLDSNDINTVIRSLKKEFITTGPFVRRFENIIKKKFKTKYAYSCINATAGLHLAFLSINLKKNDIVIMPIVNFIAAYRMANLLEAKVFFADVDPLSGQMTPETVNNCIKINKIKKIKLILTMYLGVYQENVNVFYKLKKKYKCYLIEDACHAFGAKYKIKNNFFQVGSCKHSDICIFSFHPVKPITTGEGGMITTNNKFFAEKIKSLRSHGIKKKQYYWDYDIYELGFNYRLSDINCSLGVSQIKKLSFFLDKRKKIHNYYKKKFNNYSDYFKIFDSPANKNSYHLILISFKFDMLKSSKNHLISYLNKKNIYPQFHYKPINKFSFFKKQKYNSFFGAELFYKNSFSLPVYHSLSKKDQEKVIKSIISYIKNYKKV